MIFLKPAPRGYFKNRQNHIPEKATTIFTKLYARKPDGVRDTRIVNFLIY